MKALKTDIFIERAEKIHNNLYNYSQVEYINNYTMIKIECNIHGFFNQRPASHLQGQGCPLCKFEKNKFDAETFIIKANDVHKNKYDYSKVNYVNAHTKINIVCPIHGMFKQSPYVHLQGKHCFACNGKKLISNHTFIEKAKTIHGDKYDYSKVNYLGSYKKIIIICPKHGSFEQQPCSHLWGRGCPICKESNGEKEIRLFLTNQHINFQQQFRISMCCDKNPLPFDFAVFDQNTSLKSLIEYQGIQHYKPVARFGGEKGLAQYKLHDNIKKFFCQKNNIPLYIIPFWEKKNINKFLNKVININE